jgi:DNA end-binding protein Ku
MARAIFKAQLEVGGVSVPVKLYAAAEDRAVHFRLLHAKDKRPVQQQLVDPRSGEPVAADAIQKGVEVDRGVYVVLDDAALAAAAPEESRAIELLRFVPPGAVDLAWYRRPYYLGPDRSGDDYFALAAALHQSGRVGIARWVMRKQRHFGVLETRDGRLLLVALRSAREVVPASALDVPRAGGARVAERKLAEQLVAALDAAFDPDALRDEYRERVEKLLAAKAKGRSYRVDEPKAPRRTSDLAAALERSLAAAKDRRAAA